MRCVIKPGDANEFASVNVDFKANTGVQTRRHRQPILYDDAGKAYNTAQSLAEVGSSPAFSCTFSFRVPKGTTVNAWP